MTDPLSPRAARLLEIQERVETATELKDQRDQLLEELKNIANANPRIWDEDMRDQFQQWAQSRARAAITRAEG